MYRNRACGYLQKIGILTKMILTKKTKSSGFTLIEITVATLIFVIAVAGLYSTISSMNRPSVESFEQVQAVYTAKETLENLKYDIDAEFWDDPDTSICKLVPGETYPITYGAYSGNYTVIADANGGRWVDLTISW